MGDPIRFRRKYVTPTQPWQRQRILDENKIVKEYGLKSKTELWKVEAELRKYRRLARQLIGAHGVEADKKKKILIEKAIRVGLLPVASNVDNVLSLEIRDLLERRIQTIVYKKGFANTALDARKLITHGHVSYKGAIHTTPGTIVPKNDDGKIAYVGPARVKVSSEAEATPILAESKAQAHVQAPKTESAEVK